MIAVPIAGRRNLSMCLYFSIHFINFFISLRVLKISVLKVKILKTYTRIVHLHDLILLKEMKENLKSWLLGPCNFRSWLENNVSMNYEYFDFHIFQGECKYICALFAAYSTYIKNDIQLY